MTSSAGRYRSALSTPEKTPVEKQTLGRSSISISGQKAGGSGRPETAGKPASSVRDTFRLYRSEKDAAGMLLMHPKDHCYDPERLYEETLHLKADLHRLRDENKQLKTRITRLEKDCLPPIENSSADRLETVVRDQQSELRKKDDEIVILKREIQFYKIPDFLERLRQTQLDKDALRKMLDTERRNSIDVRGQIADLLEKVITKGQENDRLKDEVITLTNNLSEANKQKAAIEEELNTRKDFKKIPILKNEIVKLRAKIEALEGEIDQLTVTLKQQADDLEHTQQSLADSQTAIQKKDFEISALLSLKSILESDIAKLKSLLIDERNSAESISKSSQTLEKEIELLRRQLKNLTITLATREAEIEKLRVSLDSEHEMLTKKIQMMLDEFTKEKNALVSQNAILTTTVTEMRKQSEEKEEQIIRGRDREKELKREIERLKEEFVLRDGEIEALKGQIEGLMRNIDESKAGFEAKREGLEGEIRQLMDRIDNSAQVLFKKIQKKLKKHEQDATELTNHMSESGKESVTPLEFKKALKSLKIVIDKLALKLAFRLLGSEECEISLEVLKERLKKQVKKDTEEQTSNPGTPAEQELQTEVRPSDEPE